MKVIITEKQLKKINKPEVFLGGTTNKTNWREELIPLLDINYFNPVVTDWNEEAQQKEIEKRKSCDFVLYVITPKMEGCYSIAEVTDDSNKRPEKTILCVLDKDDDNEFNKHQSKSLDMLKKMIENNGATVCNDLESVAKFLNK